MRESLIDGGYVIMLEGISAKDRRAWVFSRPLKQWIEAFESSGFRNIAIQRYYYNWVLKASSRLAAARRRAASILRMRGSIRGGANSENSTLSPSESAAIPELKMGLGTRILLRLDSPLESRLLRRNVALRHSNCGFLFQAV